MRSKCIKNYTNKATKSEERSYSKFFLLVRKIQKKIVFFVVIRSEKND